MKVFQQWPGDLIFWKRIERTHIAKDFQCQKSVQKRFQNIDFSIRDATILKENILFIYICVWFIKISTLSFVGIIMEVVRAADRNFYTLGYKHFVLHTSVIHWPQDKNYFVSIFELSTKCEVMKRKQKMQMQNLIPIPSLFLILHVLFPSLYTANTLIQRYI